MYTLHDIIKIRFSQLGYLPDTPYHLVSDEEMCDAFIQHETEGKILYFYDNYPCLSNELRPAYDSLVEAILYHVDNFKESPDPDACLPNWVYSYMLDAVVGPNSDPLDIHDLITPMGMDNIEDQFTAEHSNACYEISRKWLMKLKRERATLPDGTIIDTRPPTVFGEPHVIKSVRLSSLKPY